MNRFEQVLIFSILCFLAAGLLYAWGPPLWFSRFPYAVGLKFLLSIEIYFICCAFYCMLRLSPSVGKAGRPARIAFLASFAAVPVFSFLVLSGASLQRIQFFIRAADTAAWAAGALLSLRAGGKKRLFFCASFALSSVLYFAPGASFLAISAARFSVCFIYFLFALHGSDLEIPLPSNSPPDITEAAARFSLSRREADVLRLVIEGHTNHEIAEALFISLSTVKTHISSIFLKTGARNRLEASLLCRKE